MPNDVRRLLAAAVGCGLLVAGSWIPSGIAAGWGPEKNCGSAGGSSLNGLLGAGASSGCASPATVAPKGSDPAAPACSWEEHGYYRAVGATSVADWRREVVPGGEVMYVVRCPPGAGAAQYTWGPVGIEVDRQALINEAHDEAVSAIPVPALNMSPRPEVGGIVNLGLWLAVDDPGQINALAEAGPVWASVTARFVGMTWDMGNGDVVNCDGLGVPYPDGSNQIEQGPCGYTYTEQPPIDGYAVTATGHWEVQLVTSFGENRMLDPIDRAYTFAYDVDEIITTGVG